MKAIAKKQFCGDRSLRIYTIEDGTTQIGDWAFSGCKELAQIKVPATVEEIGKNAFTGCEKLEKASLYGERISEWDEAREVMLAIALRFFPEAAMLISLAKDGSDAWLGVWDRQCRFFLNRSDEEGYQPFLAGGEEDYGDDNEERERYSRNRRLIKAGAVLARLLVPIGDSSRFLLRLQSNDMALECLMRTDLPPGKVLEVYEEAGLLTKDNCGKVLDGLSDENVELRALLLGRMGSETELQWEKLEL